MYWAWGEKPSCTKGTRDCCLTTMVAGLFFANHLLHEVSLKLAWD